MSEVRETQEQLSPLKRAILELREMRAKLDEADRRKREPIAIVGIGLHLPGGARDESSLWRLLADGVDAISEIPRDRWDVDAYYDPDPDKPGKMNTRHGAFISGVDQFDAEFFGVSPREAVSMDPQHRLLMETSWEALENAGIAPAALRDSPTGVFVGVGNCDYWRMAYRDEEQIDAYAALGNSYSVAAGRLSYFLGVHGPSIAVDTACSASLVAVHLACGSLRSGECTLALAAGVNLILSPEANINFSKSRMLAPDGRCKTFDAGADGYVRGEGCGVVVLKTLSTAQIDGNRILAVIRGSAVNQDGRSGGLTAPNGPAQEAVIRAALAAAGVDPHEVSYLESHGTGTSLGDPIEVRAATAVLCKDRPHEFPLAIGSIKTNIGHLEAAAGVAGLLKVVVALQKGQIPPHLHFRQPNPHIAWSDYPVRVVSDGCSWSRREQPRLAGVSSFGFSGTNAHVVIQEAPRQRALNPTEQRPTYCLPLSARTDAALRRLANEYAETLPTNPALSLSDIERTAGAGRSHFERRLAVVADTARVAQEAWSAFALAQPHPSLHFRTSTPGQAPEVVFLFPGQGTQYAGMGRLLYETSPVFRNVIDHCDKLLGTDRHGHSLKSVLWSVGLDEVQIHDTAWTQPALFAVEYGLAQLWRSWGIEPAAVIGHSVGEYVAACVAGVFSLEDGLRLIAERGRLMAALPSSGAMAAIFASKNTVSAAIAPFSDRLSIAAINSPENVVISGESRAIDDVLAGFAERNVRGQKLLVSVGAHSPCVEPVLDAMETLARSVTMNAPRIPVAWNLTGGLALPGGSAPDAIYWRSHLREPVRFLDGVRSLHGDGYRAFLEVGPHPTLLAIVQQSLPHDGILYLSSLRRDHQDWTELLGSVAKLYVHGAAIDWKGLCAPYDGRTVSLPTYPFERRSYWLDVSNTPEVTRPERTSPNKNPLVGMRLPMAVPIFETVLTPENPEYLQDHRVYGEVLVAGSVLLEMAQACAIEAFGLRQRAVESFKIREPLVVRESGRAVQIHFAEAGDDGAPFSIYSRAPANEEKWQLHATGRLVDPEPRPRERRTDPDALAGLTQRLGAANDCNDFFCHLRGLGIELGTRFRSLRVAHRRHGEALAYLESPPECGRDRVSWGHPSLLDGAIQACGLALQSSAHNQLYLLAEIERIELATPLPQAIWCYARVLNTDQENPSQWKLDLEVRNSEGAEIGAIRGG